jgi:hypothetical protein
MKKILVPGFFILSILLTAFVTTAVATIKLEDGEVEFTTLSHTLSDTEVNEANTKDLYTTKLNVKMDYRNVRKDEVKITKHKNFIGWETKVDTLKTYVTEEYCGCD